MTVTIRQIETIDTISVICTDRGLLLPVEAEPRSPGWLARTVHSLSLWVRKRRGRDDLRNLTDEQLRDIGVTRPEAEREAAKSFFWD